MKKPPTFEEPIQIRSKPLKSEKDRLFIKKERTEVIKPKERE